MARHFFALCLISVLALLISGCPLPPKKTGGGKTAKEKKNEQDKKDDRPSALNLSIKDKSSTWGKSLESKFGDRYAVLVGADSYTNHSGWNLPYIKNNVRRLKKTLEEDLKFPSENIITLTGKEATKKAIENAIESKFREKLAGKDNLFLFYYGGHGFLSQSDRRQHFLTYYSQSSGERRFQNTLRDSDIRLAFTRLKKNLPDEVGIRTLCIFDACQSPGQAPVSFKPKTIDLAEVVLNAAQPGQYAMPDKSGKISLFTKKLCEALKEEAKGERVEVKKVFEKVEKAMARKSHQPSLRGKTEGFELFTRQSIPVRFEVRDALRTSTELKATLKINDREYQCPVSLPSLEEGEYFLAVSQKGYYPKLEKIRIGPEHEGQTYQIYLSPEIAVIKGVVKNSAMGGTSGMEVSLSGGFSGVMKGYHQPSKELTDSGRFHLVVPLFEDVRQVIISQNKKVLSKESLKNYSFADIDGHKVRVYDLQRLEVNASLPGLESLLPQVEEMDLSKSRKSDIFILKPELLKEDNSLDFPTALLKQTYRVVIQRIQRKDFSLAKLFLKRGLRLSKGKLKVAFERLKTEKLLWQARQAYQKGNASKAEKVLEEARQSAPKVDAQRVKKSSYHFYHKVAEKSFENQRFSQGVSYLKKGRQFAKSPAEVTREIARRYLAEIRRLYENKNHSRAIAFVKEARAYGSKEKLSSLHYRLCQSWLEHTISSVVQKGDFSEVRAVIGEAEKNFSSNEKIQNLVAELKRERFPLYARKAYRQGNQLLRRAELEKAEEKLTTARKGANAYYEKKIEPLLKYLRNKLVLKYEVMALRARDRKDYATSAKHLLKSLKYNPDNTTALLILKGEVLTKLKRDEILTVLRDVDHEILSKLEDSPVVKEFQLYWSAVKKEEGNSHYQAAQVYSAYLEQYPTSTFSSLAKKRLASLEAHVYSQLQKQSHSDTLSGLQGRKKKWESYLSIYPQGTHSAQARNHRQKIAGKIHEKKDALAFSRARDKDQKLSSVSDYSLAISGYRSYIQEYPRGKHLQEARKRLEELQKKKKKKKKKLWEDFLAGKRYPSQAPNITGFTHLQTKTYSCGGQSYTVHEYRQQKTGMEFVLVPGGSFQMGSTSGDSDEKPVHQVSIKPFLMSKYEVTQGVWKKVMGTTPWRGQKYSKYVREGSRYPAVYVSWKDAKKFCQKTGLSLPSEAQWEYACRAGTSTKYYWGNSADGDYMWYEDNAWDIGEKYAHQVGQKKPNAFGLYDMSGNVWEWCEDNYHDSYRGAPSDGSAWYNTSDSNRVDRGGSFHNDASYCRSANRFWDSPSHRSDDLGFRLLRPVPGT